MNSNSNKLKVPMLSSSCSRSTTKHVFQIQIVQNVPVNNFKDVTYCNPATKTIQQLKYLSGKKVLFLTNISGSDRLPNITFRLYSATHGLACIPAGAEYYLLQIDYLYIQSGKERIRKYTNDLV